MSVTNMAHVAGFPLMTHPVDKEMLQSYGSRKLHFCAAKVRGWTVSWSKL